MSGDEERNMKTNRATYFWFYFSPQGRGVGGGL